MFKCTIRDLLWLVMLSAVISAWFGHYRTMIERQRTIEKLIADEEQQYHRMEAKWNEFARQIRQKFREIGDEHFVACDMNLAAQYELIAVRKRLSALGVTLPKPIDGRDGGTNMTPEAKEDLETAKQEYEIRRAAKFGPRSQ